MSEFRLLIVSIIFLISLGSYGAQAQINSDVVAQADKAMGRTLIDWGRGGSGSGFVLSEVPEGTGYYYITNHHVIDGGSEIQVGFKHNNQVHYYDARVLHSSRELDLALLRITPQENGGHRPGFLTLREGNALKGEQVAALGYPGSSDQINGQGDMLPFFETTLTQGAISKITPGSFNETGRTLEIVQHTASVNKGNSGGPLIDYCGSVLGINTVISVWSSDGRTPTNNTFWASSTNPIAGFLRDAGIPFTAHQQECDPENPVFVDAGGTQNSWWIIFAVLCGGGAVVIGGIYYVASHSRGEAELEPNRGTVVPNAGGRPILAVDMGGQSARFSAAQLKSGVTIGRASENTLTVTDRNLSRRHASLSLQGRKMILTDLGSSNGTKVDGQRIKPNEPVQINTRSKVELGGITLVLKRP
ncbi:trypsin-like peptidase domain-containing protein [uncultured Ruegeria sp.]|uniref:trypsin-like peptidase domain-containing protein n=1 Tax=uncultured Ruegeria sp. TaxID=259304 RepID=UPI00262031A1|nr:trypsin-like peptidase domain-containing protein [uncultured Ruegeria sp.]